MDAGEIKERLISQVDQVVPYLYPAAARKGNYFHLGNLSGQAGHSLRISIDGSKAGCWIEGDGGEAGDILDLWKAARGKERLGEVLPEIREYLGISNPNRQIKTRRKEYEPPPQDAVAEATSKIQLGLARRGISKEVMLDLEIGSRPYGGPAVAYPYRDDKGAMKMVKYIDTDLENGKKRVNTTANSMPILFGMFSKLVRESDGEVTITEGEVDAMSYQTAGIPAVSVPFGAKGESRDGKSPNDEWIANCYEWLEQFHTIYLSMDMDESGREAANAIAQRLGLERCKFVDLPRKDANEVLTEEGADALVLAHSEASHRDPDEILVATAAMDRVWDIIAGGKREEKGIVPWGLSPDTFPFRIRPKEGTIWTGYGGHGKSNALYMLATWLACKHGHRTFIGSYEEDCESILSIMAAQAAGRWLSPDERGRFDALDAQLFRNIIIHDYRGTVSTKRFFELARYAVRRFGVQHAILDSASTTDLDLDDKPKTAEFAKECAAFWKETGAHLHAIFHPRKGFNEDTPPGKADIKGAGYLGDLFFNVITVHRPPDDDIDSGDALVAVSKQKVGGKTPRIRLYFSPNSYRLRPTNTADLPWVNLDQNHPDLDDIP